MWVSYVSVKDVSVHAVYENEIKNDPRRTLNDVIYPQWCKNDYYIFFQFFLGYSANISINFVPEKNWGNDTNNMQMKTHAS